MGLTSTYLSQTLLFESVSRWIGKHGIMIRTKNSYVVPAHLYFSLE
jgi:hypothetical protein